MGWGGGVKQLSRWGALQNAENHIRQGGGGRGGGGGGGGVNEQAC